jgi:hypothetical protein
MAGLHFVKSLAESAMKVSCELDKRYSHWKEIPGSWPNSAGCSKPSKLDAQSHWKWICAANKVRGMQAYRGFCDSCAKKRAAHRHSYEVANGHKKHGLFGRRMALHGAA